MFEYSLQLLYLHACPCKHDSLSRRLFGCLTQVTEHANFEEDLGLEKGDVVVLVLAILKKYDLSLSYVEARRMTTCVELIDYIESQVCQEYSSSSEGH